MNESFNSSETHDDCTENGLQSSVDGPMESCQNWQVKQTAQRLLPTRLRGSAVVAVDLYTSVCHKSELY